MNCQKDVWYDGLQTSLFRATVLSIAVFVAAAGLNGCAPGKKGAQKDSAGSTGDTIAVKTLLVTPQTFEDYGTYYGNLSGVVSAVLVSYMGGRVDNVLVNDGARVAAGQSLGSIDGAKADAMYETAKLNEKIAHETFQRTQTLFEDKSVSQLNLDQARLGWLNAQSAREDAAKAWRGQKCISPVAGVVLSRFVRRYDEIAPGTPTFSVADIGRLNISVGIAEGELGGVQVGNPADVTTDQFPDKVWPARLSRLSGEIQQHSRVAAAELTVENTERLLRPGMTVKVRLLRAKYENALVVPAGAVLAGASGPYVVVVENGVARIRFVTLGVSNEAQALIANGLAAKDELIIAGHHQVADGSAVVVR